MKMNVKTLRLARSIKVGSSEADFLNSDNAEMVLREDNVFEIRALRNYREMVYTSTANAICWTGDEVLPEAAPEMIEVPCPPIPECDLVQAELVDGKRLRVRPKD